MPIELRGGDDCGIFIGVEEFGSSAGDSASEDISGSFASGSSAGDSGSEDSEFPACCTCYQMMEFRFKDIQGNRSAPVNVTNPGGNQLDTSYIGPSNLIDENMNSKFLDANRQPVVFAFSSGISLISYEWVTGDDATARDMISWRLEGKLVDTDADWTTVHTVSILHTKRVVLPTRLSLNSTSDAWGVVQSGSK